MIGSVYEASNPLPSSKLFSGFQRAAERNANCVSVLTSGKEFRNPCLPSEFLFFHTHP